MKKIILILTLILSVSLFANEKDESYEAGVMIGYTASSGLFFQYNIEDSYSLRASGYIVKIDDDTIIEGELTAMNYIYKGEEGAFYLLGALRNFHMSENNGQKSTNIFGIGVGMGFKYNMAENFNFFIEASENIAFLNETRSDSYFIAPLVAIGFSVDF